MPKRSWLDPIRPDLLRILLRRVPSHQEFLGRIIVADGRQQGTPLRVAGHPAQEALVKALDSGRYNRIALAKPVQDGGTLVSLVPMFRRAVAMSQTVVLAYPTGDSAKDIWTTKVKPVLQSFGGLEPETGGGSRGGAARVVDLPDGGRFMLRAAGGRGESGQASITGDALFVDEVDDWPSLHRIELITQRINESLDPLAIYTSTVKKDGDGESLILLMWEAGTQTRLTYPCPFCGHRQKLEWENVNQEKAEMTCVHCGALWTERQRRDAMKQWQEEHTRPESNMYSVRWSALDSPRKGLREICDIHEEAAKALARGDHGPMRSFYRDRLSRQYAGDIAGEEGVPRLTMEHLTARSELGWADQSHQTDGDEEGKAALYSRHYTEWPQDAQYAAAGFDIQHNRIYWCLTASDGTGRRWDMAHGQEWGNRAHDAMSDNEIFETLQRAASLCQALCGAHPFIGGSVDTGDGNTMQAVLRWLAAAPAGWMPCDGKGDGISHSQHAYDLVGIAYLRTPAGWPLPQRPLIHVASNALRESVLNSYLVPLGSPGSTALPRGGDHRQGWVKHLLSKRLEITAAGNRVWRNAGGREDWLDCRIYSEAHLRVFQPGRIRAQRQAVDPQAYLGRILQQQGRR